MKFLILGMSIVYLLVLSVCFANEIFIIHGSLREDDGRCRRNHTTPSFDIIEAGRGNLSGKDIVYTHYLCTGYTTDTLPPDAILLLQNFNSLVSLPTNQVMLYVLGADPKLGVFPYSKELWEECLSKTDEELMPPPMTPEQAWKAAYRFAKMQGIPLDEILADYPMEIDGTMFLNLYAKESDGRVRRYRFFVNPLNKVFRYHDGRHQATHWDLEGKDSSEFFAEQFVNGNIPSIPFLLGVDGLPTKLQKGKGNKN